MAIGVVVALAVATFVLVGAGDDGSDRSDSGSAEDGAVVGVLHATRGIMAATAQERDATVVMIIGQEELFAGAIVDLASTRAATDEAVAAFRDEVGSLTPAAVRRYGEVLVSIAGLVELRAEVDAQPGPRGLNQLGPVAVPLRERYSTLVASVLDAHDTFPGSIGDLELRMGVELHALALRQQEARSHLVNLLLVGGLVPEPGEAFLPDLTAWADTYRRGRMQLAAAAAGTVHQPAADRLIAALDDDPIPAAADELIASGVVDVQAVLDAVTVEPDAMGWLDFATEVEDQLLPTAEAS